MSESRDLFEKFYVAKAGSVPQDRRILVLGPPRSGKSTFINRCLGGCGEEHIVGLVKTGEAPEQPSEIDVIKNFFKKLEQFFPLLERANRVPIDSSTRGLGELDERGIRELRLLLGGVAPKYIVEDIVSKIEETGSSSVIAYYIPWDIDEGLLDEEVMKAVEIIRSAFRASGAKVKWLNAEYIPPGFVKEVLDLLNIETEEEVRGEVGEKVKAYVGILKSLGLLEGVEWESHFVTSVRTFIKDFAGRSLATIPYIAPFIAGNIFLGPLTKALITLFTNHIIKTPQSKDLTEIVNQINLGRLKAENPSNEVCGEFSELGKIVAYKIAAALNLDVEDVCGALAEIAGIEVEELRRIVEDLSKRITEVEKKVEELEKDVEELEKRVERAEVGQSIQSKSISIANRVEFIEGRLYPDIEVVNGKLSIRVEVEKEDGFGGEFHYYGVVEAGSFGDAINNLIDKIKRERVVVVVGPRGIGKSVLAASVIWRLFDNGDIGLVAGVNELNENNDSHFITFIKDYLEGFRKVFGELLILYDPSITRVYERKREEQPIPEDIRKSIGNLLAIINSYREGLRILIVLPKDIYDGLGEDIRNVLNQYKLKLDLRDELDLRDAVFLAEVVKEYSKKVCRDKLDENKLGDLVNEIAQFDEGHALIARLAGTLLAEKFKCNIDDARKVVEESEREATVFIAGFINSYFKINDDEDRARVLAEVFAIRKPFVGILSPGDPILTPGIVKTIKSVVNRGYEMPVEKAYWLSIRHNDLIEHTIENLLSKKDLGRASEVWTRTEIPRITGTIEALEHFINNYGDKFIKELDKSSWKRLALIAGHALAGVPILPGKEDRGKVLDDYSKKGYENLKKSLEEALSSGVIDYYLIVNNEIPIFVRPLVAVYLFSEESGEFWKNLVNREDLIKSIVRDAEKLLEVWSGRKRAKHLLEALYALGLAVITSKAIELGRGISEEDASTILEAARPGVELSLHPSHVKRILTLLMRLGFKAPQHYTSLLSRLSGREVLDEDEVSFIFDTLNMIHSNPKYFNKFKELVWPLVEIVEVYSDLLSGHLSILFSRYPQDKIEDIAKKMCILLNVLREKSPELATIAEAFVLIPSLKHRAVEGYVKESCSINDIIAEADAVLNNLEKMAGDVSKLVGNNTFMEWIETRTLDLSEEGVGGVGEVISNIEGYFTSGLAIYKLDVDRLDEARELYNKAAEIAKSIGDIDDYLVARSWILRVNVIKASNLNEYTNVAKGFEDLWNEALENLEFPLLYLELKSYFLSEYLVYLASIGRYGDVERLLNEYAYLLNYYEEVSVLTKLMLKILGYTKTGISSREIVDAYSDSIDPQFLPALKLALGIKADHDECEQHDEEELSVCLDAFLAVKGIGVAMDRLKDWVQHRRGSEFYERVKDLNAKLLVQLLAPISSATRLAFMLYSLINGDTDLARRHALLGSMKLKYEKLLSRLFREAHDSCCDIGDEKFKKFKLALLKLFYYHI